VVEETQTPPGPADLDALERARREKLRRWREQGIDPYGRRVDGLVSLAEARSRFDRAAHDLHAQARQETGTAPPDDARPRVRVAGRCIQHRAMGKLVFLVLRDESGDLQVSVSKGEVDETSFDVARKLDYGDIVVAEGPMGMTQKEEICVWAARLDIHCKSLVPPPEKYHGLTDPELRYRRRAVDMVANPGTLRVMRMRSQIVWRIRQFMEQWGYLEVETPVLQPVAGGAAARPFVTQHNALDMPLYLRIAPELYLKRLLVGGMTRVYEISRNFRNEGVDRSHNPEFTTIEAYESFGDCWTMLDLTEALFRELALFVSSQDRPRLPFGDVQVDYSTPFDRVAYGDLFERTLGFPMTDAARVRARARELDVKDAAALDDWLLADELFERVCRPALEPARPTFVTDYPSAISPLTRAQRERPHLCERWELFVAGMELGTAYTELNDPDVQLARFREQLRGAGEEARTFRTLDEDFLYALRVGMPPAGGLGLGVDRMVMLLAGCESIRDVILFPLMRQQGGEP
jgi:lysyl-tRNA synthetase class 2